MRDSRAEFFRKVFEDNVWNDAESRSGEGSNLAATVRVRSDLPAALRYYGIRSILDAPCGDFVWMKLVDLGQTAYIGGDIVPQIVATNSALYSRDDRRFSVIDIVEDDLPDVDLIFCRDCLIHFSNDLILRTLRNMARSSARFVMLTHDVSLHRYAGVGWKNIDLDRATDGGVNFEFRPLNLTLPPFNLPPPVFVITEGQWDNGKVMAMWTTDQIRSALDGDAAAGSSVRA